MSIITLCEVNVSSKSRESYESNLIFSIMRNNICDTTLYSCKIYNPVKMAQYFPCQNNVKYLVPS